MGPLVTKEHRDKVASYVDAGEEQGAKLVVDGREVQPDGGEDGFWLGPTPARPRRAAHERLHRRDLRPVLSVLRVDSYEHAVDLVNSNQYGNGTAIFTNDGGAARRFQHEVEVGMIGINVPIPVPMAYYSFGGWKNSLFGDAHAHGAEGVHFFTRGKVITSRWLTPATVVSTWASRRTPEEGHPETGRRRRDGLRRRRPPGPTTPRPAARAGRGRSPAAT